MKDIVTTILTDAGARDGVSVENALSEQAAAVPWLNVEL